MNAREFVDSIVRNAVSSRQHSMMTWEVAAIEGFKGEIKEATSVQVIMRDGQRFSMIVWKQPDSESDLETRAERMRAASDRRPTWPPSGISGE